MTPITEHRPASNSGKIAAALFTVVAGFPGMLAAGAPWGAAAYGGTNAGVLPESLRVSSAVAAVVYLVLATIAGTSLAPAPVRGRILYGAGALMTVGAILNIASPSFIERIVWTPGTILLVITLWRAARLDATAVHPRIRDTRITLIKGRRTTVNLTRQELQPTKHIDTRPAGTSGV